MSFKSRINKIRKRIMVGLTKGVGGSTSNNISLPNDPTEIKRVLISRPNSRLGNQLLITSLIQEVENSFPNCKIDLFVRSGVSKVLTENYSSIDRIIILPKKPFKELGKYISVWINLRKYQYDLIINVDKGSSSGRLSTKFARGKAKFFSNPVEELAAKYDDYIHIAKNPVYNLKHLLSKSGIQVDYKDIPTLNIKLSAEEIRKGKEILDEIVKNDKKTIGIYTFATGAKCFSPEWWENTYTQMLEKYGESYNIVEILPVENVSQIDFKAPSYYSRDIREMAGVMANTEMYVGADCGIMHLANASCIPVVGLFSVTNMNVYRSYGNGSVALDMTDATVKDIIREMDRILSKV